MIYNREVRVFLWSGAGQKWSHSGYAIYKIKSELVVLIEYDKLRSWTHLQYSEDISNYQNFVETCFRCKKVVKKLFSLVKHELIRKLKSDTVFIAL